MLGLGKKKKKDKIEDYNKTPEKLIEDSWSELKLVVDRNMEATKDRREEMTSRLNEYRNKVWKEDDLQPGDSRISFNILFAIVSTIAALLTDSKPKARVVPLFPYLSNAVADAYNRNLDYVWEKLELQDLIFKTVTWALITSKGIAEIGYCKGEGTFGLYYDLIDPRDFFIAPGYEDLWEAPYCGVKESVPVAKVKALFPDAEIDSDIFFSVDSDNKAIDETVKYTDATDSFMYQKAGKITWYKVWMRTDELLVKDEDANDIKAFPNGIMVYYTANQYLGYKENEYLHNKPPFVDLGDYYNPGMFDSISEGDQIHGITKEINIQMQAMMKRARRQTDPSTLVDLDQINGEDFETIKQDYQAGKVGQMYGFSPSRSTTSRNAVQDFLPKETDDTSWQIVSSFKATAEYILGYTEMLRGEATKTERQSAVEVSILSEASSIRIRPKIRALERFIKRMTYLYVCLMQQYWIGDDHWMYTKTETGEEYYNFKGAKSDIQKMIISDETLKEGIEALETNADFSDVLSEGQLQEYNDYERFAKWAEGTASDGPVMFPFEIEIESDSTLPLDKQSRAQLALRLYSMKAIDREALLDTIEFKNKDEILARMAKLDKQASTAQNKSKKTG